jgi:hypothetical protein
MINLAHKEPKIINIQNICNKTHTYSQNTYKHNEKQTKKIKENLKSSPLKKLSLKLEFHVSFTLLTHKQWSGVIPN